MLMGYPQDASDGHLGNFASSGAKLADAGTSFDIAGSGKAKHVNMLSAIAYARLMARSPRKSEALAS